MSHLTFAHLPPHKSQFMVPPLSRFPSSNPPHHLCPTVTLQPPEPIPRPWTYHSSPTDSFPPGSIHQARPKRNESFQGPNCFDGPTMRAFDEHVGLKATLAYLAFRELVPIDATFITSFFLFPNLVTLTRLSKCPEAVGCTLALTNQDVVQLSAVQCAPKVIVL